MLNGLWKGNALSSFSVYLRAMKLSRQAADWFLCYVSIHYLFSSFLVWEPVHSVLRLRFVYGVLLSFLPSILLATILTGGIFSWTGRYARALKSTVGRWSGHSSGSLRILLSEAWLKDGLSSVCIYFASLSLLLTKVSLIDNPSSYDELNHLAITKAVADSGFNAIGQIFSALPYPPFFYVAMSALLNPFGLTLLTGRIASSIISSFAPVIVYHSARLIIRSRPFALAATVGYILSSFFQILAFRYMLDGMTTLWLTFSFLFFLKAMRESSVRHSILCSIFFLLCVLTYYPPAISLAIGFLVAYFYARRKENHRYVFLPLLVAVLAFIIALTCFSGQWPLILRFILFGERIHSEYFPTFAFDLVIIFGWSPYLAFIFGLKSLARSDEDEILVLGVVLIFSAFSTSLMGMLIRRAVSVYPIFLIYALAYLARGRSRVAFALVWLNSFWWGLLNLIA